MKKLFLLLNVLVLTTTLLAQTSLRGTIVDANKQAIVGATVTLANQDISTTTNNAGVFTLLYLEPQDEEVIIEADGYIATIELVQLHANQANDMGEVVLQKDIAREAQEEILLNLSEEDMNDDEGRSQAQASASSASQDVFNSLTSFAWSTARYRNRGYEQTAEQN